eukprot:3584323-Rhodomonas_salina.1
MKGGEQKKKRGREKDGEKKGDRGVVQCGPAFGVTCIDVGAFSEQPLDLKGQGQPPHRDLKSRVTSRVTRPRHFARKPAALHSRIRHVLFQALCLCPS